MILSIIREVMQKVSPVPLPFFRPGHVPAGDDIVVPIQITEEITPLMVEGNFTAVEEGLAKIAVERMKEAIDNQDSVTSRARFVLRIELDDIDEHKTFELKGRELMTFLQGVIKEVLKEEHQPFFEEVHRGKVIQLDTEPVVDNYPPESDSTGDNFPSEPEST